jgi:hypothetical protein
MVCVIQQAKNDVPYVNIFFLLNKIGVHVAKQDSDSKLGIEIKDKIS